MLNTRSFTTTCITVTCAAALFATACNGGGDGGSTAPPASSPVASVAVTLSAATVAQGSSITATAVINDAAGKTLTGRSFSWSSSAPAIASVDGSGLVTAVAPGTALITATSEGKSGSAAITVTPPPVASVAFTGAQRVKVGDTYTYTATARLANGTIVDRPVTWEISDPSMGTMIPTGQLTPLHAGSITLQAHIDGTSWEAPISSYDWQDLSGDGHLFAVLEADIPVNNRYGVAEYPELVIGCSPSGYVFLWVNSENFITQNGNVWYNFDGGTSTGQVWDELGPDYTSLWYPGNNLETKSFASKLAAARTFSFGFTEFDGPRVPLLFRVTGLAPHLEPLWTACPSTTLDIIPDSLRFNAQGASTRRPDLSGQLRIDSQLRRQRGPRPSANLPPTFQPPAFDVQPATRRPH